MFTGIVEELGTVADLTDLGDAMRLTVTGPTVVADAATGDSIAVNGCCLTVVELGDRWWAADAQRETIDRTTMGALRVGDRVNLERPVRLADRLGGHVVQGHVDGVGTVASRDPLPDGSVVLRITAAPELLRYTVEKGSITVDGTSLTITSIDDAAASFGVALVPHTLAVTTFGDRAVGDGVNLEVDVLAKYVERLLLTTTTP